MSNHGNPRHLFYLVIVAAVLIPALRIRDVETATERAYRICGECGLEPDEIDRQIENKSRSTLSREEEIKLYHSTGKLGDDLPPCLPCMEAVLDAAKQVKENQAE